jgi:hypothetical protein
VSIAPPFIWSADEPNKIKVAMANDFISLTNIPPELLLSETDTDDLLKGLEHEEDSALNKSTANKSSSANGSGWRKLNPKKSTGVGWILATKPKYYLTIEGKWSPSQLTDPLNDELFFGPTGTKNKKIRGHNAYSAIVYVRGQRPFRYNGKTVEIPGALALNGPLTVYVVMNDMNLKDNSQHPTDPMQFKFE